jgi:hypothetical protein
VPEISLGGPQCGVMGIAQIHVAARSGTMRNRFARI